MLFGAVVEAEAPGTMVLDRSEAMHALTAVPQHREVLARVTAATDAITVRRALDELRADNERAIDCAVDRLLKKLNW